MDDWDEGASDAYVPSEVDNWEEIEEGGDMMEVDSSGKNGDETGNVTIGEDEGETAGARKKRAPRHSKKSRRTAPKASDYTPEVEGLLNHAAGFMRALIVAENPMPSVDDSINLATDAFELAKRDRPHINFPDDIAYISIVRVSLFM